MIKEYVRQRKEELREALGSRSLEFAIVQVGDVEASNRYVRNKVKDCEEIGITAHVYKFDEDISMSELSFEIRELNAHYDAVMIQLPLPAHLDKDLLAQFIDREKDVDGMRKDSYFKCCTPKGIMGYLKWRGVQIEGASAVVIGRSDIVGKPMAQYLLEENATVTICHSKTKDLKRYLRDADIIVCAVGRKRFLDCSELNGVVVDVGINFDENGKLVGDCYNTEGKDVTPVPGGVGLLTRCALLENLVESKFVEVEIED